VTLTEKVTEKVTDNEPDLSKSKRKNKYLIPPTPKGPLPETPEQDNLTVPDNPAPPAPLPIPEPVPLPSIPIIPEAPSPPSGHQDTGIIKPISLPEKKQDNLTILEPVKVQTEPIKVEPIISTIPPSTISS